MRLTTGRYIIILLIQTLLLVIDWGINISSLLTRENNAVMLILFIVQDACLILALSALLLTFFSTYVFQTGLVYLLYERFRATLLVLATIYYYYYKRAALRISDPRFYEEIELEQNKIHQQNGQITQ
ncbi:hypothetical protein NQ314_013419 [Rhamnusium bicolor]|uniref:Transmembrane protein 138 n=1 Tax=Rhamnusium bicolor TaxID=1586634 RepID=A0AAV8X5V0_9CUCU|nr:hypothetical protein NQ314_013419 [Rhamnusium bicolor]